MARTCRRREAQPASVATTPPIASPWPPRNFVALCSTSEAPSSSGRCRTGVAKVLSIMTGTPSASSTSALMSSRRRSGLAGVSAITSPVSGRSAARTPPGCTNVTRVPSSPVASTWSEPP